jgi:hypothetical protein
VRGILVVLVVGRAPEAGLHAAEELQELVVVHRSQVEIHGESLARNT